VDLLEMRKHQLRKEARQIARHIKITVKPASAKPSDTASASVPDPLAARRVNPDTGLTHAEVDIRRKEHGCMASAKCNVSEAGAWQIA
jgi:hypothetical protein